MTTQWEYCSIQQDQADPQHSSYAQEDERTFFDRLMGAGPPTAQASKYSVTYYFYRVHGLEDHTLYEGDDLAKVDDATSKYVAILGMYGWEAIRVIRLMDGREHWYFKREIAPSNQYIHF